SQISTLASQHVVDKVLRPAAENAVREQAAVIADEASGTAREKLDSALEAIPNVWVREQARTLLDNTALPDRAETAGKEALLTAALQLTNQALDTVVYSFVHSLLYAIIFAASNFVLRLAVRAMNWVVKLPGLRELNELGGLVLGAGKGAILAFLCLWVLSRTGVLPPEAAGGSVLAGLAGNLFKPV
ncbi:MAG: CvpA family protein, partial [Oscillospiraceae bacterium]|nr:CvpA family protein [Oscillospiraceae bacterium]